jgi:hypothetical protein
MAEAPHELGELGSQRNEQQRNKAIKANRAVVDEGLRWILADVRGRAFIWAELGKARVFQSSFHVEPAVMAFNEGRRSAGLELLAEIERLSPDSYARMAAEARARKQGANNHAD